MPASRPTVTPYEDMTIARARRLLGRDAAGMTDADVLEACRQAETLAHVIVQMFLATKAPQRAM